VGIVWWVLSVILVVTFYCLGRVHWRRTRRRKDCNSHDTSGISQCGLMVGKTLSMTKVLNKQQFTH
jgi:hypothetical protein